MALFLLQVAKESCRLTEVSAMLAKNMMIIFFVVLTPACALLGETTNNTQQPVYRSDIEPYIAQWEENKQSIERLKEMEQDLTLLLQLVASQADLEALPEQLRSDVQRVTHKPQPQQTMLGMQNQVLVKLSTFLQKTHAERYITRFTNQYPQLSAVMSYKVAPQTKNGSDFYLVLAGPYKTDDDANKVCFVLHQLNEACQLFSQ
ncbi:SPOR domain-containing protein [Pseudoalteromonas sp. JBTF-M23]|uniref:SPOR domain-containing protein n=1 Tax=Pseudoalteromonas caenipelagi TaxID=2726988 RepID=A0A849VCG8_9GAMM|nr:SPOR domain-containing protein [Pseudoalteromonas caenipelagi]NOU50745.1 SPOR domain-containing protein [Pseudoalteromonas caenipelagi]